MSFGLVLKTFFTVSSNCVLYKFKSELVAIVTVLNLDDFKLETFTIQHFDLYYIVFQHIVQN